MEIIILDTNENKKTKNPPNDPPLCVVLLGCNNKNCEIHSFFLESFFLEFGENYNSLASELY